ncbi:M50 family metallopeptidase [Paenibacillus polymyxa]|uniref:M50 family metallopeptidase n=1 Tax=Paenibacillus polymyxa TaxID=1406 RepID=UPI0025B6509F|nr:M50 family metallopeptidase [Paenibacillus polymyxa]MDN4079634.1 M50 family metallopeptidase [Paenibacillus polymyxa]MDN4085903.1 M50 family metallopeptidase [Paenibacillus polymyxa]MDN4106068.1 M50 family metallopeptidase [Paenibacillus polymyxa]MDN4111256.1 M50 family metallopeptidase [Paenibacillus polymyxa]MDN4116170.1 M50 family metallopeptidase [Paenibacillus polymyxa]
MINVRGVTLSLHPLFVLVMLTSVLTGHFIEIMTLFTLVFIHELGHATAASLLGARLLSIQMLPFGGVAVIEDQGKLNAWKEIVIALAGPLQNGIMIIILLWLRHVNGLEHDYVNYIIQGNAVIALFNLLPILPLDGGKILQSLISLFFSYHRTLVWTFRASIVTSLLFCLYGISPLLRQDEPLHLNLLAVGIFLLYSNIVDYRNIPYRFIRFLLGRDELFYREAAKGSIALPIVSLPVKHLEPVLRLFRRDRYHMVYVMNEQGRIVAVLPEQRLIRSYFAARPPNGGESKPK